MNWRNVPFLKLWGGQSVSWLGTAVTQIALPTIAVLGFHAGPFELGLLIALQRLPFPFLALAVGVWIDQLPRRRVMIIADIGRTVALASIPIASGLGALTLFQLYAVGLVTGVLTIFFDLAYLSYVPALVGRDQLGDANAKTQVSQSTAEVAGPGLGGLLIQAIGAGQAIAVDAASFLVSFASIAWIGGDDPTPKRATRTVSVVSELGQGLGHVFRQPLLRSLIVTTGAAVTAAHLTDPNIYPFFYRSLSLTPGTVGLIFSAAGVGGIAGAIVCRQVARRLGPGWTMALSGALIGVLITLQTVARFGYAVPILLIALLLIGFANSIHDVTQVSLRQSLTPDHLQGRMNSVFRTVYWGGWPLGNLVGGYLGSTVGPVNTILIGGVGFTLFSLITLLTPLRKANV